jgi:hypothetical protein
VASWSANRLDVFVRGADDQLWQKAWNGGWMGCYPLGELLTSSPAVASWAPNRLDVFVRGSDNALYQKSWNGIGWSAYQRLGGNLEGAPTAVSRGPNLIDAFSAAATTTSTRSRATARSGGDSST